MFSFPFGVMHGGRSAGKVKRYLANNGLRILTVAMPNDTAFHAGIFVRTGAREEEPDVKGIAHFLEHMTFKGTRTISSDQVLGALDGLGCSYNATTSHETTTYFIAGDPEHAHLILAILLSLYLEPTFPQEEIERERNVVLEELRMGKDDNQRTMMEAIMAALYGRIDSDDVPVPEGGLDDTLAQSVIGTEDTIANITRQRLLDYRGRHYRADNTVLSLAGRFDVDRLLALTEKLIGSKINPVNITPAGRLRRALQRGTGVIEAPFIPHLPPAVTRPRVFGVRRPDMRQTMIALCFYSVPDASPYANALDLVSLALSTGMASRLSRLLRGKHGISYYNHSDMLGFKDTGVFVVSCGIEPSRAAFAVGEIVKELLRVGREGLTKKELAKVQRQANTHALMSYRHAGHYMKHFAMAELQEQPFQDVDDMQTDVKSVTLDQVRRVANQVFALNNLTVGVMGPTSVAEVRSVLEDIGRNIIIDTLVI